MNVHVPILADNAEMLASAYRNLSAAQKESHTKVVQRGVTLELSSWMDGRVYRNSLTVTFRDEVRHDKFTLEMRDLIAVAVAGGKLVIQSDDVELKFKVVDELPPVCAPCPPCRPFVYRA